MFSIFSGIVAFASIYIGAAGLNFNLKAFSDPTTILTLQGVNVPLARWSMITDIWGYYLLLLPAIFYLHKWMKERTAWSSLFTTCACGYVFAGAIGASILTVVWPSMLYAYPTANAVQQEILRENFRFVSELVYGGLWNLFEVSLAGIWWLGLGIVLRYEYRLFGMVTMLLGISCMVDAFGNFLDIKTIAEAGLNIYLVLAPAWAMWLGIILLNPKVPEADVLIAGV
jgi:hypothetical protein